MPRPEPNPVDDAEHRHPAQEETRIRNMVQAMLMTAYAEKHQPKNSAEAVPSEVAWGSTYGNEFRHLYVQYPDFADLVDNCDGSPEQLDRIQGILDEEIGPLARH